jgi:hypothetical protein
MNKISQIRFNQSFIDKVTDLGYSIIPGDHPFNEGNMITPIRSNESWRLKFVDERWILIVNEIPQIAFSPDETLKFLTRRLSPQRTFSSRLVSSAS